MTITQTVDIPASRKLVIDVPPEVPEGKAVLIFKPMEEAAENELVSTDEALASARSILDKHLPAFIALAQ